MEYYQAPRRGSGSGTSKRENARRAKIRKRRFILSLMGLALIGLIVVAVVVLARGCAEPPQVDLETGKFRSGVYINGMNLSGKTIDEVKGQLESNESYALNNIAITLSSAELTATITGADMNATSNLSEVMEQALSGGSNQVYYTKISIDDAALSARIDEINATTSAPPVDASFSVDFSSSGKPAFNYVEGSAGYGLDSEATIALVKQTIESGQLQATITPTLTTIQPSVTVDDVKAHTTLIGKFTTTYDFKGTAEDTEEQRTIFIPNRAFNVEKGASMI
ncbi:MAG: peptidoglycan binding domain-containing protein, partial [Christensenella sp.]